MHHGYNSSPALIFDLMEPHRPKTDAAVLAFALSETFSGADFVIRSDGVVRLAPQLARRVCQLVEPGQEAALGLKLTSDSRHPKRRTNRQYNFQTSLLPMVRNCW
jgi:hypothetical protein